MKLVLEKLDFAKVEVRKTLFVKLKRKTSIDTLKKVRVLIEKMDLESAGTSNGLPPRKKLKHSIEKDLCKRDLASLPKFVLQRIFSYLDTISIQNCAVLCSTFYNLSKDSSLYKTLNINYRMSETALQYHISKVMCPRTVEIEYNPEQAKEENFTYFDNSVIKLLRNCGEDISCLRIDNCKDEEVLTNIGECVNLERLILGNCKSSFASLLSLCTLTNIKFSSCHFPQKVVKEVIKNNVDLKYLYLSNNVNVNPNEICELLSRQTYCIREIHINERKRLIAKSLKTLSRLTNLKKLVLISDGGFDCNPDDSLEHLAAGCSYLEILYIDNWMEINDSNFIPALRMFSELKTLELRRTSVTIKSCREAALSLPLLEKLVVVKCQRIKRKQLMSLRKDFEDINILTD